MEIANLNTDHATSPMGDVWAFVDHKSRKSLTHMDSIFAEDKGIVLTTNMIATNLNSAIQCHPLASRLFLTLQNDNNETTAECESIADIPHLDSIVLVSPTPRWRGDTYAPWHC